MNDFVGYIERLLVDEGCIFIEPRPEHFKIMEHDFLEGLRRVPAKISSPPGTNPFSFARGKRGQWVIAWVPEKE